MTIAKYLKSKDFKREYACWWYAWRAYRDDESEIDNDEYELWNDEKYEEFINTHEVDHVETGWEYNDGDGEMWAFAKIYVKGL